MKSFLFLYWDFKQHQYITCFINYLEAEAKEKDVTKFFPSTKEVKQLFVKSGITGVQRKMKSDLNAWKKVRINLAILGNSGVGKSSFINAIRG